MNAFDLTIMAFFNQFAHQSYAFDRAIEFLSGCHLLKGGVLMMILWWLWFKQGNGQRQERRYIVAALISSGMALLIARLMAILLPLRLRPVHPLTDIHFVLPYGVENIKDEFIGWSSFPSDHAVLFFALSTALFVVSRKLGYFAYAYTFFFIALPRIFLGLHYPSDVFVGAGIGIVVVLVGTRYLVNKNLNIAIAKWSQTKPELFYPMFFLISYQIVDMFTDVRQMISATVKFFHVTLG